MTRRLQRALEEQKQSTQQESLTFTGILGIPLGGSRVVEVPTRNGFVYVRLRDNPNEVIQAFNNQVAPSYNLPVIVERQGNKYVVSGVDTTRYENNWNSYSPYLPRHGNTHSFDLESGGGGDIVWVYPRQFMPALVFPSGSLGAGNVIVSPYTHKKDDGTWRYTGNTGTPNISNYRPSSSTGAIMALVYLNTDDGNPYLLVGSGTVFPNSITGSSQIVSYIPQITNPANQIPLAAVRLITGTNAISWDNIYDVRQFLHSQPTGTAGGSISVQDEGVSQGTATVFNFVGDNVSATVAGGTARIFITGSSGGEGINTGTLDSRYLKLDTSNDPLHGQLQVTGTIRISKDTMIGVSVPNNTPYYAESYLSEVPVADFEQLIATGTVVNTPVLTLYRSNVSEGSPKFTQPAIWVGDDDGGGSFYDGILKGVVNGTTRTDLNPHATGTVRNYLWDTDKIRPTGTIHTSWRVSGTQVAYLDVSGTFYSNGSPLIKEAPVNGSFYVRDNASWEEMSSGQSVLGVSIGLTGTSGAYQATGLSVTLPSAGTYIINGSIRSAMTTTAVGDHVVCKLRNTTDSADIADSETLAILTVATTFGHQNSVSMVNRITVSGSKTIELYAAAFFAGTVTASIEANSSGKSRLTYLKVG